MNLYQETVLRKLAADIRAIDIVHPANLQVTFAKGNIDLQSQVYKSLQKAGRIFKRVYPLTGQSGTAISFSVHNSAWQPH